MFRNSKKSNARWFLIVSLLATALISGCATQQFGPLPTSDEDFKKSPNELREQFAGVRDLPGEQSLAAMLPPKLSDLEAVWGVAPQPKFDSTNYVMARAPISALFLSLGGPTGPALAAAAIPWAIPPNENLRIVEKGDYSIRLRTLRQFGEERVMGWEWIHHSSGKDIELFTPETDPKVFRSLSRIGIEFGSGWADNKLKTNDPSLQGGISFAFGTSIALGSQSARAHLLLGYHTAGAANDSSDDALNIQDFPIELGIDWAPSREVSLGLAAAKHLNPKLSRNYAENRSLDSPIGAVLTFDYRLSRHLSTGARFERVQYKVNGEPSINGSNVALTLTFTGD